jgi:putative PIG3 family NAD(P)H quinone oxidoreductase
MWAPGDRVTALTPGGAYAEYVATHESHALPWPARLSAEQAGALCETFFTVWTNLFDRAGLKAGETVLIHGGSSGIGTTAIQLARVFGARVFCTVGSAEKAAACQALGAERAIRYRDEDFVEIVRAETAGRGADVILDMVGGDYIARNVRAAAESGRIVMIAFLCGPKAELNFAQVMVRRLTLTGSTLRPRTVAEKAAIAAALRARVWPLLEAGRVAPVMDRTYPLAEAAEAHRRMESSAHVGKIVLVP